jgi:hypothetical protein
MSFKDILVQARQGSEDAINQLLEMYRPLLIKGGILNGQFDEDLYQEQCITLLHCIDLFIP